jgi:hypothetical protein
VKPNPLNLSVNTGVGKQFIIGNNFVIKNNNFIEHNKQALSLQPESAFFTTPLFFFSEMVECVVVNTGNFYGKENIECLTARKLKSK